MRCLVFKVLTKRFDDSINLTPAHLNQRRADRRCHQFSLLLFDLIQAKYAVYSKLLIRIPSMNKKCWDTRLYKPTRLGLRRRLKGVDPGVATPPFPLH